MRDLRPYCNQWIGTPFVPHACQPGAGVDCVNLVAEILHEAGLIHDYAFPTYRCDQGMHTDDSAVLAWLNLSHEFNRTDGSRILAGDVLCFRVGRVAHHVGLALGPVRFIHAMRNHGVLFSSLRDPTYRKRLDAVYRPSCQGFLDT